MRVCCCSTSPHVLRHLRCADGRHDIQNLLRVLDIVPTPKVLDDAYREMLVLTGLQVPPRLVCATGAFNMGGFFVPGLIVVGMKDSQAIAEQLWATATQAVNQAIDEKLRAHEQSISSNFEFLLVSVRGRIISHELGHAAIQTGFRTPYADEEAGADYVAGLLDGRRNKSLPLGELMFWSIGCEGVHCTHPPPRERAGAYRAGYLASRMKPTSRGTPASSVRGAPWAR